MKLRKDKSASAPQPAPTSQSLVPIALIEPDVRARFTAEFRALASDQVAARPAHFDAHVTWATALATTASRDAAQLVTVPLAEGALTADEIADLAPRVAYVHELLQQWNDARATGSVDLGETAPAAVAPDSPAALRASMRGVIKGLLRAFDVRFERNPAGRKLLHGIRTELRVTSDAGLLSATVRTLRLCRSTAHRDFIVSLPKGEARDVERLATMHAALVRSMNEAPDTGVDDLSVTLSRAWSVVARSLARVCSAGRYLYADDPARKGSYAAWRRPTPRKKKPA